MISAEVPVMLSKALELFITELSLRAWLQTEDSKRRTVQVEPYIQCYCCCCCFLVCDMCGSVD